MYWYSDLWLILIPLFIGMWAQMKIQSTYSKYSRIAGARGFTGADVARRILDDNGLYHVQIERIRGNLTDHYDPRTNVVRLSDGVFASSSIAAVGVAAHECGHAVQHAQGYLPMKIRGAIIPITNFGSRLAIPLILVGVLFQFGLLINIGLIGYALIAIFQLVTLPVEFNASSRALAVIDSSAMLSADELQGAKKVLSAAAMTYVAALISSLSQLLRMFLLFGNRRGRRD